ncbi:MAG: hypothetical protein KF805_16465 [Phycisphaeraceae bacterium]|nr:hypothetical protein [Phycisphaeraceae bacterium]
MSAVRRFSFSRQAFSSAAESFRSRSDAPRAEPSKQDPSPGFAQSFSDLVSRTVRIASIDLDRDPWWLYFRRRR